MKYLFLLLISFLPSFVNAGDPPALIDPPFTVKDANPMPSIISGFGPRNPKTLTATRFHQGLDLSATPVVGDVITSKRDGKITQITKRTSKGNVLYVTYGTDEFGFHHIFGDSPDDVQIGDFALGRWSYLVPIPRGVRFGFIKLACDVIFIKNSAAVSSKPGTAGLALMANTCPVSSGTSISHGDGKTWEVRKTVSNGSPMAVKGDSGSPHRPHLHLFYRTAGELKNPLYRINHEASAYTLDYTDTFTPEIKQSALPKKVFVRVNFGREKGFDLEGVNFRVQTSGAAPRIIPLDDSYTLGGIPTTVADPESIGPGSKSGECNNVNKSKCRISLGGSVDDKLPEILAYPTNSASHYAKKLDFAVQLPKLEPGDYQLIVEARSVRATQAPLSLPFKVVGTSATLLVEDVLAGWGGLPAAITMTGLALRTVGDFRAFGNSASCGTGERGLPYYSGFIPPGAALYAAPTVVGVPYQLSGPSVNRRNCSSFVALQSVPHPTDPSQPSRDRIWINATGRGQMFTGFSTFDWEYQVRYDSGNPFDFSGRACTVGLVPNSGFFISSLASAHCSATIGD